jgi:hypothetical protein
MKIYVVFGQTGEYSDQEIWMVKAFKTIKAATKMVLLANRESRRIFALSYNKSHIFRTEKNSYDPNMKMDYTGTNYYYERVELENN